MVVYAPAQIISAPVQLITAPAQPPATGAVVYSTVYGLVLPTRKMEFFHQNKYVHLKLLSVTQTYAESISMG